MTSQEELFTIIDVNYFGKLIFGDDSALEVKRKGIVTIPTMNGKKKFIGDTLLTLTLKKDILSTGKMMEEN
jgi:hypothetical protein